MTRILALAAALALTVEGGASAQEARLVRMGTASIAGVYYPVGVALCRLVNAERRVHGIRCAAVPSGGSVANIDGLRDGTLDLALVQSDIQAAALQGEGAFADAPPFDDLRALFSLYPEPLTIVARAGDGIVALGDLEGRRVSYGASGSGARELWETVMAQVGWTSESFAETPAQPQSNLSRALCEQGIDAFVLAVGHPALTVQEATTGCEARLVPASGDPIDALVAASPVLFDAEIPGGLYRGNPAPTETFGVGATLVARADLPDDVAYTLVAGIFDRFDDLRGLHPVLADLDAQDMATDGLTAALHPGAARYFRDRGWIE